MCALIETNPKRGNLVDSPKDWPWSNASAEMKGKDDRLVHGALQF
jgi:hypothetical protein